MKLDRNINPNGRGKYALLKMRTVDDLIRGTLGSVAPPIAKALDLIDANGIIDYGQVGTAAEFMVIRLRDKWAKAALAAYANAARSEDPEYAAEIDEMAARSGPDSPFCKKPD